MFCNDPNSLIPWGRQLAAMAQRHEEDTFEVPASVLEKFGFWILSLCAAAVTYGSVALPITLNNLNNTINTISAAQQKEEARSRATDLRHDEQIRGIDTRVTTIEATK